MEQALKIIIAKSANAFHEAIQCLHALRVNSPMTQNRYNHCLSIALHDPHAVFTADERAILAEAAGVTNDSNATRQAKRRERLDLAAQAVGYDSWSKLETAVLSGDYTLPR